ncbi:MAG: hypothetical protein HUU29_13075, partial [Planctomycetaceae bacterium]|nr:hypothetical protein [Planctomycetaceae bacterium]
MSYQPYIAAIDLRNAPVLVIGGGRIGTRKALALIQAGANITVIAPELHDELRPYLANGRIRWINRKYRTLDLNEPAVLIFAATDDGELNARIVEDGKATVAVLQEMIETWKRGGDSARDIFLMQKLQALMASMVATIDQVEIERITVLPAGASDQGSAAKAVRLVEEMKGALGVDLPALVERMAGGGVVVHGAMRRCLVRGCGHVGGGAR